MKLSSSTIDILKNFVGISPSIKIEPGKEILSISPCRTMIGYAKVDDEFTHNLCVYELGTFLNVLGLFKESPELKFTDKFVDISGGDNNIRYFMTDEKFVKNADKVKMPAEDVRVSLKEEDITNALKAAAVIGVDFVSISSDGETIKLGACSPGDDTAHSFAKKIGDGDGSKYNFLIKSSKLKFLPGDYEVAISSKGISEFTGPKATYWVGLEKDSTYQG